MMLLSDFDCAIRIEWDIPVTQRVIKDKIYFLKINIENWSLFSLLIIYAYVVLKYIRLKYIWLDSKDWYVVVSIVTKLLLGDNSRNLTSDSVKNPGPLLIPDIRLLVLDIFPDPSIICYPSFIRDKSMWLFWSLYTLLNWAAGIQSTLEFNLQLNWVLYFGLLEHLTSVYT